MVKKRRSKLLYKLLVLFVGIAIIPLFAVRTIVLNVGQQSMKKESINVQLEIAHRSADTVYSFIEDIKNILFVIQKPKEFVTMDIPKQRIILENLIKSYPAFMKIVVLDASGRIRLKIPRFGKIEVEPLTKRSKEPFFLQAIEKGGYVSNLYRSQENYPFVLISVPIETSTGKPVGVLMGEVNLIAISNLIAQIKIGEKGFSFVVDEKGSPIAHPNQKIVLQAKNLSDIPLVSEALKRKEEGGYEFKYKGENFLGTYVPVRELGWRVIVQQPLSVAYLPATKMKRQVDIFLIGALIITVSIGIFFSYKLVKPIKILQKETEKVAAGDFDTDINVQSRDEIGVLAEKFASMAGSLKKMTGELKQANEELDKWNKELEDRVEERTRQLRESQEKLVQSERLAAVGQMANVIGHEMRNPLAGIKSAAYLIKEIAPADTEIEKCLAVINREINASTKIAEDLLGFSRTREPVFSMVNISNLLEETLTVIVPPESIKVFKEFAASLPQAKIDRDEIRQVFVNLTKNAFEIMTEKMNGGELHIKTGKVDNMIQVEFNDTGPGISKENMKKMFTPFFSTKAKGTGLGLAACQRIIERIKGKIWVESEGEGKGSTFFVRLPVA
ncbi:MAG: cache domain-containing protein [Elusimicrobia bacterium]|nr:cache domain-containing protein [Elusimicrobiota bacterium]